MRGEKQQTDKLTEGLRVSQKVAVIANEATKVESALLATLKEICAHSRWPIGHVYLPAEDGSRQLRPTTLWQLEYPERFETFRRVTEQTSFDPGIGLPGRVLTSGKPAWIIDVTKDPNFPRAKLAKDIGVKAGFGFPVLIGTEVVAVLEFFSTEAVEPDEQLLEIMAHVGTQLGRVFERQKQVRLQVQLVAAQKLELVGRLSAGIAHDFNNYLSVIHGFAELIQRRHQHDESLVASLQQILHASESGNALVRQLMALTRQRSIELRDCDINQVVAGTEQMLQHLVGTRIRLTLKLAPTPLMVRADPASLEQMIMNLGSNARDAMRAEGALTISTDRMVMDEAFRATRQWAREGEYARLSIQDTGGGMDPDVVTHIFEPFFTTKQSGHGTGLGLAVVYGLVKQHKGYIDLDTAPGQGTTFHLYLPYQPRALEAQRDEPPPVRRTPSTAAPAPRAAQQKQRRVLVVDDEPGSRLLCEQILQEGYEVATAASGREALDVLRERAVDILLTDIQMPGMDGVTLIDQAAKLRPNLKVAVMSAFLTSETERRLRAIPLRCEIIHKPLTVSLLRDTIDRCR